MAQVIIPGIDRVVAIGSATADGGNGGPDDATSGGAYTGTNRSVYIIEIDNVGDIGAAVFSGSGLDDGTSGGTYTGVTNSTYSAEIDAVTVGVATADGGNGGVDDMTSSGVMSGSGANTWYVKIGAVSSGTITNILADAGGIAVTVASAHGFSGGEYITISGTVNYNGRNLITTVGGADWFRMESVPFVVQETSGAYEADNTFQYKIGAGGYSSPITITTSAQLLETGVSVTFESRIGHVENDYWSFAVIEDDTFKWRKNSGSYTTGVVMTGGAQTLAEGVQITFAATVGHTLTASWTMTVNPDTFKWRENKGTDDIENVAITTAAQDLNKGVQVTFAASTGHDLGDIWSISVEGDLTVDRSVSDGELIWYVSPVDYTIKTTLLRAVEYNLQTGVTWLLGDDNDDAVVRIDTSSQLFGSVAALSTQEQIDLGIDLDEQAVDDPLIDSPVGGYP